MTVQLVKVPLLRYENNGEDDFEDRDGLRGIATVAVYHDSGTVNPERELINGLFDRYALSISPNNQPACSNRGHHFENKVFLHSSVGNTRHFEHFGWSTLNRTSSITHRSNRFYWVSSCGS